MKFRIWDSVSRQFYYPDSKRFSCRSDGCLLDSGKICDKMYVMHRELPFKDTKGYFIYEGDVVQYESLGHRFCEKIVWDGPGWATQSKTGKFSNPFSPCINYSVVGNVMENYNLLPSD